jgi:acetylornithine deacetylase/succinyl-diaminopimelate desuccinylase-like protein
METHCSPGKTPVLFVEFAATKENAPTVLLYGHMDKQPPFTGWDEGLGPYEPVIREIKGEKYLYGRGGADDGYAIFSSSTVVHTNLLTTSSRCQGPQTTKCTTRTCSYSH